MTNSHAPLYGQEAAAATGSFACEEGGCAALQPTGEHKRNQYTKWVVVVMLGVTVGITGCLLLEPLIAEQAFDDDCSKERLGANHVKLDPRAKLAAMLDCAAARHAHGKAFAAFSHFMPLRSGQRISQTSKSPLRPRVHSPIDRPRGLPSPSRVGFISAKASATVESSSDKSTSEAAVESALLDEIEQSPRSIDRINSLLSKLEDAMPSTKLKKLAFLGDWQLLYVSDQTAMKPFEAGDIASGPFAVLEDVFHRFMEGGTMQSIDVVRQIGPFGNKAASVHGNWRSGTGTVTWSGSYMIDERFREVPMANKINHEWKVAHVSKNLMVLRRASNLESCAVLGRLGKGELLEELKALNLFNSEAILGLNRQRHIILPSDGEGTPPPSNSR